MIEYEIEQGDIVRRARKRANIRQEVVTARLGWNGSTLIDLELNRVELSERVFSRVMHAIEELSRETGSPAATTA